MSTILPLVVISGRQAFAARKANVNANWPSRADGYNRVEPIALPAFQPGFQLVPGERIYTIGSCFARSVEFWLEERGFDVPVRKLLANTELKLDTEGLLNNYGAPSILNELRWAFDPAHPFEPEKNISEIFPGKFVDNHLPSGLRPAPLELVMRRRQAVIDCTRLIASSRVIIITLGLAEVWWDSRGQTYVNETPRPSLVRKDVDRFELHVLGYNDVIEQVQESMRLIQANGPSGVRVILTVSPVPIEATHRPDMDVMVANTYSKNVLRAAVEEIVLTHDFVHYFPSYEGVTLSDRKLAWLDDQVHVTPDIVRANVSRMVRAYRGIGIAEMTVEELAEQLLRTRGQVRLEWELLQNHKATLSSSRDLVARYARVALNRQAFEEVDWAVERLPEMEPPYDREIILAELALAHNEPDVALAEVESVERASISTQHKGFVKRHIYRIRTMAFLAKGLRAEAIDSAASWGDTGPTGYVATPFLTLARGFRQRGFLKDAEHFFGQYLEIFPDNSSVSIELADVLARLGRGAEAISVLDGVTIKTPNEERRSQVVRSFAAS